MSALRDRRDIGTLRMGAGNRDVTVMGDSVDLMVDAESGQPRNHPYTTPGILGLLPRPRR